MIKCFNNLVLPHNLQIMLKYSIVIDAFISNICWLYALAIRKHPLKQQTLFLKANAFDTDARMTEKDTVLFQLPRCRAQCKKALYKSLQSWKAVRKESVFLRILSVSLLRINYVFQTVRLLNSNQYHMSDLLKW